MAISAVLFVLVPILGLRQALIVCLVVPLVLSLTLAADMLVGVTINRISLFALILSLGMLVDDAIVVMENIHRHYEQGVQDRERLELVVAGSGPSQRGLPNAAAAGPTEPSADGGAHGSARKIAGPLAAVMDQLHGISSELDQMDDDVRRRKKATHQELFTRVLEKLDGLELDGLSDEQRAEVRPVRKQLVRRCEALSAQAQEAEKRGLIR